MKTDLEKQIEEYNKRCDELQKEEILEEEKAAQEREHEIEAASARFGDSTRGGVLGRQGEDLADDDIAGHLSEMNNSVVSNPVVKEGEILCEEEKEFFQRRMSVKSKGSLHASRNVEMSRFRLHRLHLKSSKSRKSRRDVILNRREKASLHGGEDY